MERTIGLEELPAIRRASIVSAVAREMVGREEELGALREWLRAGGDGPRALLLEGEPGIGKSTLWLAGAAAARDERLPVLASRPAEAERELAFAGLGDLFEPVLEEVVPQLAPPRRRALEAALLVEDPAEGVDPRALGVAVRNALELLADARPLVVAVDDVQWLDAETGGALAFALRRLEAPVWFLLARRLGGDAGAPELEQAFGSEALERRRVGPLSLGAVQRLLRDRLDRVFSRPTLLRLHEASGGNPFYALELARAVGTDVDPMRPLPVPPTLEELVSARLAAFVGATREALVLVSAQARLTTAQLGRLGIEEGALEPALRGQVIELADGSVTFTHPLLASGLYQGLSPAERRDAHRRLAELADDPLARARHLALSAEEPAAGLAAVLERAAEAAGAQGAPIAAAELGEHAVRLTPPADRADAHRRARRAARAHLAAGEVERGQALAAELLARAAAGEERAETLVLLAEAGREEPRHVIALLEEALQEPGAPLRLQAEIQQRLSLYVRFVEGSPRPSAMRGRRWSSPSASATPRCAPRPWPASRSYALTPARQVRSCSPSARTLSPRRPGRRALRRQRRSRSRTCSSGRPTSNGRGPCSSASTGTGASATSARAPTRSGTWRSPSFAPAVSPARPSWRRSRGP